MERHERVSQAGADGPPDAFTAAVIEAYERPKTRTRRRPLRTRMSPYRLMLTACAFVAAGAVSAGLMLSPLGFLSNALAEVAGLCVGIVIAALLIDRLTDRERERRWEPVRERTLDTIYGHIVHLGLIATSADVICSLPNRLDGRLNVAAGLVGPRVRLIDDELRRFAVDLRAVADDLAWSSHVAHLTVDERLGIALYRESKSEFQFLRETVTPFVTQIANDPTLASLLLDFNGEERLWYLALHLIDLEHDLELDFSVRDSATEVMAADAWHAAADVYASAATLAEYITSVYPNPEPAADSFLSRKGRPLNQLLLVYMRRRGNFSRRTVRKRNAGRS